MIARNAAGTDSTTPAWTPGHFDGTVHPEGGDAMEVAFYQDDETGDYRCRVPNPGEGKTVRVVLEPDPAKPEFDPTPAEATATVE